MDINQKALKLYKEIENLAKQSKTIKELAVKINKLYQSYGKEELKNLSKVFADIVSKKCIQNNSLALQIFKAIRRKYNQTRYIDATDIPGKGKINSYNGYGWVANKEAEIQ